MRFIDRFALWRFVYSQVSVGSTSLCSARRKCYGALGGGFLTERYHEATEPPSPLPNRSLTKYRLIVDELGGWGALQALLRCAVLAQVLAR